MMALRILPLLQIIIIFCTPETLSYPSPIYGTKRYGRSSSHRLSSYNPYPHQPVLRSQRNPVNYYKLSPYSQSYPEDYYYQQEYPVYYPPARTSKYEVFQAVVPYYYQERPISRPNYNFYGYNEPAVDLQEEMIQEAEREEREQAQPIGHESFYENDEGSDDEEALDEVNAAFLQNLILSQMYQDSLDTEKDGYDEYNPYTDDEGTYGRFEDVNDKPRSSQEDEDVRELKQLTQQQQNRKQQYRKQAQNDNIHWFQKGSFRNQEKNRQNKMENKRSSSQTNEIPDIYKGTMVYTDRKPIVKLTTTSTTQAPASTEVPKRDSRGQKEEFQMRPATPVRRPFTSPLMNMMSKGVVDKKRVPSVYETIKHMLDMEKSLENGQGDSEIRPSMKKRIITPEESLTRQLSILKKSPPQ